MANLSTVITKKPFEAVTNTTIDELVVEERVLSKYYSTRDTLTQVQTKLFETSAAELFTGHRPSNKTALAMLGPVHGFTTTESCRKLADTIGFAIIPWVFLKRNYSSSGTDFASMDRWHKANYPVYIMAPVQAYDFSAHVNEDGPKRNWPIFAPKDVRQAFLALEMAVPTLRGFKEQIASLRNRLDDYYNRLQKIETDVQEMHRKVDRIAQEAAEAKAAQAEAKQRERVAEWYASVTDPLALYLPKGATIASPKTTVVVGPCWGGDMPKEVVALLEKISS